MATIRLHCPAEPISRMRQGILAEVWDSTVVRKTKPRLKHTKSIELDEHKSKYSPLDVYFSESIPFATNNINEELNELDIQANIEQAKIHNECS